MTALLKMRPLSVLQLSIMLFCLLPGEVTGTIFNGPSVLNVSSCPVSFYGETYSQIYVSYPGTIVVLCFDGYYNQSNVGDCVLATIYEKEVIELSISNGGQNDPEIRSKLPILNPAKCVVSLFVDNKFTYRFHNYGTQGAFSIFANSNQIPGRLNLRTVALIYTRISTSIPYSQLTTTHFYDVSSCRYEGSFYKAGASLNNSNACFSLSCNSTSGLTVNKCGSLEICSNQKCVLHLECSVIGSSVIDFYGNVNSIPDRCGYKLLSLDATPGQSVVAKFQEQRRKDVSMLDSLLLDFGEAKNNIVIEQDGKIRGDATQIQNIFFDSDLGISGTFLLSEYAIYFLYDGYATLMIMYGPAGDVPPLQGLCGNSSDLQASKVITSSPSGCEILHSDTEDSTIDCDAMTQRCNLINGSDFSFCHSDINPEPYVKACIDTMCRYPALDGLDCHFLNSYGTFCDTRLFHDVDWQPAVNCSYRNTFCEGTDCKDHEFCGFVQGQPGCYCRALFAEPYRTTHTYGQLVCDDSSASFDLVGCLLEDIRINYTDLHLNDDTCRGHLDSETHMVHFLFNGSNTCGTNITADYSQIIFQNVIQHSNASKAVHIDFSCVFTQPADQLTLSFGIQDNSVGRSIKSGNLEYNLTMRAYEDANHWKLLDWNSEIQLNQKVWIKLTAEIQRENSLAVVIDSCWATNEVTGDGSPRYNLIESGCAIRDDSRVTLTANGVGISSHFSFNMFRFSHNTDPIHLHCRVVLCPKQTRQCVPNCAKGFGRRRRARSTYVDSDVTHISMV
uniref:uncharacterized protein LOC131125801 isoform X2 n=1 Tax=Doryrhamphus excisus TaxID=161450 RepID=UPI0025ADC3B1|nr:uncharacterized protein LOC131125801 isoform X2 [Doryrhamphus excisus]